MAVMLSDPAVYSGGRFEAQHDAVEKRVVFSRRLRRGEVIMWKAWQLHRVTPVTRGLRHVLVLEFWAQPPNLRGDRGHLQRRVVDRCVDVGRLQLQLGQQHREPHVRGFVTTTLILCEGTINPRLRTVGNIHLFCAGCVCTGALAAARLGVKFVRGHEHRDPG